MSVNGIVLGYLYPLILQIYWLSVVTPAYNLGPRNTASLNTYSNLNLPNSLPINSLLNKPLINNESVSPSWESNIIHRYYF